jgi:hypothetical protein
MSSSTLVTAVVMRYFGSITHLHICNLVIHIYPRVEAGYNTSTAVPASRKRRQKGNTVSDEPVKYGYWELMT